MGNPPPYVGFKKAVPFAYVAATAGPATLAADKLSINVPACTVWTGSKAVINPATNLIPDRPNRTLYTGGIATAVSGASLTQPQRLALSQIVVTAAGGAVSNGSVLIDGLDERGAGLQDTVSIGAVGSGSSKTVYGNKYFATINSITPTGLTGANAVITEYQFRGYVISDANGQLAFDWSNTLSYPQLKHYSFEVQAGGILPPLQDWREIGPLPKSQRIGSQVVDWSGGTPDGLPDPWRGTCIYAVCELLDGSVMVAGNGAAVSIWDKNRCQSLYTVTGLPTSDNISSLCRLERDVNGDEIIYIGTYSNVGANTPGKLVRWNRTQNTYSNITLSGFSGAAGIQRLVRASSNNAMWVLGDQGLIALVTDNGTATPSSTPFTSNIGAGSTNSLSALVYVGDYAYFFGGGGTGPKLIAYNARQGTSTDLSAYLPGTSSQRTTTTGSILGAAADHHGKIVFAGLGSAAYIGEWYTGWTHARTRLQINIGAGASIFTIPAGFRVSDGTRVYRTVSSYTASTSADNFSVEAIAVDPGFAGFVAQSTVTTLVDTTDARVTSVSNTVPGGFGRLIANGGHQDLSNKIASSQVLSVAYDGRKYWMTGQGGNLLSWDGMNLNDESRKVQFKGRMTYATVSDACVWVCGDEGRLFSIPR